MKNISRKTRKRIIIPLAAILVIGLMLNANAFGPLVFLGYFAKEYSKALPGAISKAAGNWVSLTILRLILATFIYWGVFSRYADVCDHLPEVILMNPKVMIADADGNYYGNPPVENLVNAFIGIAQPFYVLAIVSVAFYLLFVSGSPLGRARAKASLIRLVLSMGLIILTIPIIQLCLDISEVLTGSILDMGDTTTGIAVMKEAIFGLWDNYFMAILFNYWNSVYFLMFSGVMFFTPFVIVGLRYFMVLYFTALFPLTVLCYAFYFTRNMGGHIFRETFRWIFIQPLWALILIAVSAATISMPLLKDPTARMGFGLAAFIVFIIAPLIVVKVMDWLAMLMIILTSIEFPGMHGVVGMIDELQVEGPETEEITPPPPIRPHP
ncbi:MAG: hypothetical protein WAX07_10865 [Candidatus Altiarchaeia archaeon]